MEQINIDCGHDEIKTRINEWRQSEGAAFCVYKKEEDRMFINRSAPGGGDIHLKLFLRSDHLEVEGYVEYPDINLSKPKPISPKAFFGGIQRRAGWKDFQSLKATLTRQ